eukprot:jgi/Chrzof1/3114/Cz12g12150.t1
MLLQVFHAPHIARMSSALGTRFDPIRYVFSSGKLISNVRYSNPLLGSGWLSAAGSLSSGGDDKVCIQFDEFWFDLGADNLRPELTPADQGLQPPMPAWADQMIGVLGRAAFLPQFAVFPVLYLDDQLAVFSFPPLKSNIAVRKVAAAAPQRLLHS